MEGGAALLGKPALVKDLLGQRRTGQQRSEGFWSASVPAAGLGGCLGFFVCFFVWVGGVVEGGWWERDGYARLMRLVCTLGDLGGCRKMCGSER